MDNELKDMRDMLIELRTDMKHLTLKFDDTLKNTLQRVEKLEERMYVVERNIWYACGAFAFLALILPYVFKLLQEAGK